MVSDTPSLIVNGNAPFFGAFFCVFCKNERQCSVFQAVSKPFFTSKVGGLNRLDWVGMLRFRHFAYMPGYDRFCPIPNVALEYYPKHGHFTYGASFDGPWWQHYDEHKYFQLRNYQLHTRYYLRSGDINKRRPGDGAAFKGLFFSAYAHAFIYNICFGEKRGWEGEGYGAGLGIGYVLPLGRSEHWRLEFGLQAGFFNTPYDPYQWRCPINPDSDPEQYYYKWYGDAKNFKKRQHRYTWLGPSRLEITLSYDILYRRNHKKGVCFRSHEAAARY